MLFFFRTGELNLRHLMLSAQMANQSSFQGLIPLLSLTIVFWAFYRSNGITLAGFKPRE
jgi:hypothetical protein